MATYKQADTGCSQRRALSESSKMVGSEQHEIPAQA